MKYTKISIIALLGITLLMTGCLKPVKVEPLEEIASNETAFVIPLEGDTLNKQGSFDSVEFLENRKVASKRITIPLRERRIGRFSHQIEWIPTVKVITVNRSPVTREWTIVREDAKNQTAAIEVESKDSIGLKLGVNITAMVEEPDTARFLYFYTGKSLADVIDTNVRGEIQTLLSEEFGSRELETCKNDKNMIFESVRHKIIAKFENFGVTITSFGLAEGFTYEDREIQQAINDAYVAEMRIQQKEQEALAQKFENERLLSIAENERKQAEEFAKAAEARSKMVDVEVNRMKAEAVLNFSTRWDGKLPYYMLMGGETSGANFLMNMPN